jgi:hypothetical protein
MIIEPTRTCWQVLAIQATQDASIIRKAYAKLAKQTRPENDPLGFHTLRQAYEQALQQAQWMAYDEAQEENSVLVDASDGVEKDAAELVATQDDTSKQVQSVNLSGPQIHVSDRIASLVAADQQNSPPTVQQLLEQLVQCAPTHEAQSLQLLQDIAQHPDMQHIDTAAQISQNLAGLALQDSVTSVAFMRAVFHTFELQDQISAAWQWSLANRLERRIATMSSWDDFKNRAQSQPKSVEHSMLYGASWWQMLLIWGIQKYRVSAVEFLNWLQRNHADKTAELHQTTLHRVHQCVRWPMLRLGHWLAGILGAIFAIFWIWGLLIGILTIDVSQYPLLFVLAVVLSIACLWVVSTGLAYLCTVVLIKGAYYIGNFYARLVNFRLKGTKLFAAQIWQSGLALGLAFPITFGALTLADIEIQQGASWASLLALMVFAFAWALGTALIILITESVRQLVEKTNVTERLRDLYIKTHMPRVLVVAELVSIIVVLLSAPWLNIASSQDFLAHKTIIWCYKLCALTLCLLWIFRGRWRGVMQSFQVQGTYSLVDQSQRQAYDIGFLGLLAIGLVYFFGLVYFEKLFDQLDIKYWVPQLLVFDRCLVKPVLASVDKSSPIVVSHWPLSANIATIQLSATIVSWILLVGVYAVHYVGWISLAKTPPTAILSAMALISWLWLVVAIPKTISMLDYTGRAVGYIFYAFMVTQLISQYFKVHTTWGLMISGLIALTATAAYAALKRRSAVRLLA